MNKFSIAKLGPGLLFAGAAIGVSHLVQSTRAGAEFGWGFVWALLLINLFKYPFFQYGPRFALATNTTLLDGYHKLGKGYLWIYFILNLASMFTIQTAVTIVTAGLASQLFGITENLALWGVIITLGSMLLLLIGKYQMLDRIIKIVMVILALSSVAAFSIAFGKTGNPLSWQQVFPDSSALLFFIAFLGWMPAPLDVSIMHSIWSVEKNKIQKKLITVKEGLFDFNVGYIATVVLALCFLGLGALVMFNSGMTFSNNGNAFAGQLIQLYTSNLGASTYTIIALAAFTTMLSTTITTLDASPIAMSISVELLFNRKNKHLYLIWIIILALGTGFIFLFLLSEMGLLVQIATVLSFLTSPLYAFLNYRLVTSDIMPKEHRPKKGLQILSLIGITILSGFTLFYILQL